VAKGGFMTITVRVIENKRTKQLSITLPRRVADLKGWQRGTILEIRDAPGGLLLLRHEE